MGRKDSRSRSRDRIEDDRSQSQVQEDNSDIERESKVNSKKRSEKEKEKESRNNHASKSPKKTKKENGGAVRESNKDTNKRESNRTSDKTDTAKHSSIKSERADRGSAGHIQSSTNLCIESCVTDTTDRDGNYSFAIKLTKEDAGFLQGKKGRTKMKLENVSGVKLVIGENNEGRYLQISGKNVDRDLVVKAEKYVKCLIQQRKGVDDFELMADLLSPIHNDLTQLKVPQQAVAFVTGKAGCFLRQIEEDWGVLMFFSEFEKGRSNNLKAKTEEDAAKERPFENLAIFGDKRSRRGAELKILSAVESKCPGYFKDHEVEILDRDNDLNDSSILGPHKMDHDAIGRDLQDADWKTDVLKFKQDELSFALGKKGATRKKLEDSSGCIVQYVGQFALFSGTSPQRRRIKEYLRWLFEQLDSPVTIPNPQDRDDLTLVDVPQSTVGYITGQNRQALSQIEAENGVLMFFVGKCKKDQEGRELLTEAEKRKKDELDPDATERLAIFGPERGRLGAMLRVWWSVDLKCPGKFSDLIPGENKSEWGRDRIGLDYMKICEEDIGYTLGKKGTTKIKIVNASNCELQFLGLYACMVGTLEERQNCKDYINWLLAQRKGKMTIDIKNRTDVIAMDITKSFGSWCTNPMNAEEMRAIEVETKTFIFLAHTVDEPEAGERLMIFSTKDGHESLGYGRPAAEMRLRYLMNDMESNRPRGGGGFGNNNRFGGGNSNNNGYGAHGGNMNYNNRMMMNGHGGGGGYGNGGGGGFNNRGGGRGRGGGDSRSPRRGGGGRRRNDSRGERGGDRDRRGRGGGGRRRDSRRRDSRRRRSRSRNRR